MVFENRINSIQGTYIVASDRSFEDIVEKKPLILKTGSIQPGEFTNLHNWFNKEIQFIGMMENRAIFYLGQGDNTLFDKGGFYYDVTFIISDERIGKKYRENSFRDCILINKKGKYIWK